MSVPRQQHTATRLQTGVVLIAGGNNLNGCLATTELFDPATNFFHSSGSMAQARREHTATLLNDGKVLIAGGFDPNAPGIGSLSSAELYDPAAGAFTVAGTLSTARTDHTASLLNDGRVLIAGGIPCTPGVCLGFLNAFATAELYDPAANAFSGTGTMASARFQHTATVLPSGLVVISGGQTPNAGNTQYIPTASIEIYDPATGTFSPGGNLSVARYLHTATLLDNGQILFAGGLDASATPLTSAELYTPAAHISTVVADMSDRRSSHTATILPGGQVLVVGGFNGRSQVASAEIFK